MNLKEKRTMKLNWGNSIVIAFTLFVGFIMYMVVVGFQQNIDLVAEDYYAQEINYQKRLEQKANLEKLGQKVKIETGGEGVLISFPTNQTPEGTIHFYHPSRKIFDKKIVIQTDVNKTQQIASSGLLKGRYRVNIEWKSDGIAYFQQEQLIIQ